MQVMTTRQRKFIYGAGIAVLLIPIIGLGLPAGAEQRANSFLSSGGMLAKLRTKYDLGESTLGDVDPSSSAMNLVLLGLRGPAASILRLEAEEMQSQKNWGKLKALVDTITLLQPHYVRVWQFQGWNLAYNVSGQWDATEDRFYWVKEGIKFQNKGIERNKQSCTLVWHTGQLFGRKIGYADEWKYYRQFFMVDPDPKFAPGPDPDINPDSQDNWLVAKRYYADANDVERAYKRPLPLMKELFRHYPARCQIDYASTQQKEGNFKTAAAWEEAYRDWTEEFGQEEFKWEVELLGETYDPKYTFESFFPRTEGETEGNTSVLRDHAFENFPPPVEPAEAIGRQRKLVKSQIDILHYDYWRKLIAIEKNQKMVEVHEHIYNGKKMFMEGLTSPGLDGEPSPAQRELELGMQKLSEIFDSFPELVDDTLVDEALTAVLYWRYIYQVNKDTPPVDYPLKKLWNDSQSDTELMKRMRDQFRRETMP